jgi:hypothetical protein
VLQIENFETKWTVQRRCWSLRRGMEITSEGLVLGAGTVLARMARKAAGPRALLLDGEEERILALLSVACWRSIPASINGKLRKASDLWNRDEHADLPPFDNQEQAFRLFATNDVLEAGPSPRTLMKALGLDPEPLDLLQKYNPDQPRVPAGSGPESGRWSSGDGSSAPRQSGRRHDVGCEPNRRRAGRAICASFSNTDPYPETFSKNC